MTRTLADMAPDERQSCVGMWGDIGSESAPVVIRGVEAGMVSWADTRHPNRNGFAGVDAITPRFDLPRVWNQEGAPVPAMTKEYRTVSKHPDSILGTGSTFRTIWYPTRDEAMANRDPRVIETHSRLIGIEHRYVTQPEVSDD